MRLWPGYARTCSQGAQLLCRHLLLYSLRVHRRLVPLVPQVDKNVEREVLNHRLLSGHTNIVSLGASGMAAAPDFPDTFPVLPLQARIGHAMASPSGMHEHTQHRQDGASDFIMQLLNLAYQLVRMRRSSFGRCTSHPPTCACELRAAAKRAFLGGAKPCLSAPCLQQPSVQQVCVAALAHSCSLPAALPAE